MTATILTSCSFLLIQYSSEARGYAYLTFFVMASFAVVQKSLEDPRVLWNVLFACLAVLGYLSHLTYFFAHIAFVAWSLWHAVSQAGWRSQRLIFPLIFQVLIPAGFLVLLFYVDLRFVEPGGGHVTPLFPVLAQATSAAVGGPLDGAATGVVAVVTLAAALAGLLLLYRAGNDLWVPLLSGIFLVPIVVVLVARPAWLYPRYFLVSLLFLQLLVSWFLALVYRRPYGKFAYVLIMAAILGGNAILTARLLTYGRGGYHAAVRYLLEESTGERVIVGSDHDFRNKMVLAFYLLRAGDRDRVVYVEYGQWPPEGPEWIVFHHVEQNFKPAETAKDDRGNTYKLTRVFPFAGLSGFHWALYHNQNRPLNSAPSAEMSGQ
jgi:hypothetical protein